MATKAQDFRFETVRPKKKSPRPKKPTRKQRLTHNAAERLDGKKAFALESTSRTSTRAGSNRVKPDSAQRITARIASEKPSARATQRRH